jgi:glycosyltransferase involved in cell wall biosynthesis
MKLSIVTCTYNSSEYLEKNILSVKNQNFQDFEHIFIDGFSTDETVNIIKRYQEESPNQVKFFQFKAEGISKAMNQGVMESTGEYIIHLHSDDSFYDNKVLDDTTSFLEKNNYPDWIYGKINVLKKDKSNVIFPTKKIWQKEDGDFIKNYLLKYYNYIPHQAVFIKKMIFEKFGYFDETLKCGMDPDLWLRIRTKTRWFFFDRIISNYSIRAGAQSSGLKNKGENNEEFRMIKKRYLNKAELILASILNLMIKNKKDNYQK